MHKMQAVFLQQRLHLALFQRKIQPFCHGFVAEGSHPAALGLLAEGHRIHRIQPLAGQLLAKRFGQLHIHKKVVSPWPPLY